MRKYIRVLGVLLYLTLMVLGFIYPIIGIAVLVYMGAILLIGRRRKWCSIYCPRGSFYDLVISKLSLEGTLPKVLKNKLTWKVLLVIFIILMGLQFYMVRPFDYEGVEMLEKVGLIFYRACFVSSAVGIPLSVYYIHRSWCTVCPIGNLLRK